MTLEKVCGKTSRYKERKRQMFKKRNRRKKRSGIEKRVIEEKKNEETENEASLSSRQNGNTSSLVDERDTSSFMGPSPALARAQAKIAEARKLQDPALSHFEEEVVEEVDDIDLRLYSLNACALHYYLSRHRSWAEAAMDMLDELPLVCAIGATSESAEARHISEELAQEFGYDTKDALIDKIEHIKQESPFLRKFSDYSQKFAEKDWFNEEKAAMAPSIEDYIFRLQNELRSNLPAAKAQVQSLMGKLSSPSGEGIIFNGDKAEAFVGVEDVNTLWSPDSFVAIDEKIWREEQASFADMQRRKRALVEDEGISSEMLDEDVCFLAFFQGYISAAGNFEEALSCAQDFFGRCATFVLSLLSPAYTVIDPEKIMEGSDRIEELVGVLGDVDGNICLRKTGDGEDGDGSDEKQDVADAGEGARDGGKERFSFDELDEESQEFVLLNEEQSQAQLVSDMNQIISSIRPYLLIDEQTAAAYIIDTIISCVWAVSDLSSTESQIDALKEIERNGKQKLEEMKDALYARCEKTCEENPGLLEGASRGSVTCVNDEGGVYLVQGQ